MHSNYNSYYKSNNKDNNAQDVNIIDTGFHYEFNEFKALNSKKSILASSNNPLSRKPLFYTTATFQTAANVASESANFCNIILQSQFQRMEKEEEEEYSYHRQKHNLNQHRKAINEFPQNIQNPVSTPYVHQSSYKISDSRNKNSIKSQYIQQSLLRLEQQKLQTRDSASTNISTDQHYQHYYSYYYNRLPELYADRKSYRKLPHASMAFAVVKRNLNDIPIHDEVAIENKPKVSSKSQTPKAITKTEKNIKHHVLKEKKTNNNIFNYDDSEWLAKMSDADVMNATKDFIDVKDIDVCENKLSFVEEKVQRVNTIHDFKRKFYSNATTEILDLSSYFPPKNMWIANAVKSHSRPESQKPKFEKDNIIHSQSHRETLPMTVTTNTKGTKKQLLPMRRVLIYNNQSSRPRHASPSNFHEPSIKAMRKKFPLATDINKYIQADILPERKDSQPEICNHNVNKTNYKQSEKSAKKVCEHLHNINEPDDLDFDDNDYDDDDVSSIDDDDFDDLDNVSNFGESADSDFTSDSEDGYRANAYKLAQSFDPVAVTQSYLSSQTSEESLTNPPSLLVPSLFPHVPPYLAFSSNTCRGPDVPVELYRVLKWRVTNVMPKVVRCVLSNSGMRLLKKTNDWMGTWGKHMKSPCFKTIRPFQKINHLPGSFKIGRKDACWKNLQKQMNRHGKKDFGFMPKTFIIPHDLNMLRKNWPKYAQRNVKWIIKPPASARGAGIRVVNRWSQIPKRKPLIVQKYIERPLLINGSKFDLRLYVLVTSINPLRVYMYHNGLARFASVKYSDKSDTLNDRCMHLTNYSINKFSSNYSKNEDVNACHGHKWTIKSLWTYLANRGIRTDFLWEALRNLVLRTILAGEHSINNMLKLHVESKYSCFELFGFDVLLDADLIPWLLEVNISPSLHSDLPLDAHVKAPLVQAILNTALFNVPPKISLEKQKEIAVEMSLPAGPICYDKRLYVNYLSRAEKIKHNTFTRKTMEDRDEYIDSILDHLTPDDIRCLIIAEDELSRCAPLERIFPNNETHKYLKYTDTPRYYNRLLDAWETRYGGLRRPKGIALLRSYCEDKYHLEVPPVPAKKASSVNGDTTNRTGSDFNAAVIYVETEKDNESVT